MFENLGYSFNYSFPVVTLSCRYILIVLIASVYVQQQTCLLPDVNPCKQHMFTILLVY